MFRKKIFNLQRFANIENYTPNTLVSGTSGDDSISNYGNNVTIDAGAGNDEIRTSYENLLIKTGTGNDTVFTDSTSDNSSIYGEAGNDSIISNGNNNLIDGGDGDDTIKSGGYGYGKNSTLIGGAGNDYIDNNGGSNVLFVYNDGDGNDIISGFDATSTLRIGDGTGTYSARKVFNDIYLTVGSGEIFLGGVASLSSVNIEGVNLNIIGTEYADTINNTVNGATIQALGGNDTVENGTVLIAGNGTPLNGGVGASVSIDTGTGNDSIQNHGNYVIIDAGAGNDYIKNTYANNVTINGGAGNDSIISLYEINNVLIDGGDGDDSIDNYSSDATINLGAGNDYIWNHGEALNATINAGIGNDTIDNYSANNVIINGDTGNDYIYNYNSSNVTINTGAGNDSIYHLNGDNIIINGGEGDDTIETYGDSVTSDGGAGNDSISNGSTHSKVDGGAGTDYIYNGANSVTVDGGADNDIIQNGYILYSSNGTDLNSVYAGGSNVSINAAGGDDNIFNVGNQITILGGAGNDSITNLGSQVTVEAGAGNDSITNLSDQGGSQNVLFKYSAGDGNDIINGFNETSTLQIGDGKDTFSTIPSGSDIIVTVGTGKITLVGAATLSTLNISGTDKSTPIWKLNEGTATYGTSKETLFTISGVKSLDGLSLSDNTVTVSANAINLYGYYNVSKVTISNDNYKLALGSDVTKSTTTPASWTLKDSTATYKTTYTSPGYILSNNQIISTSAIGGDTFTVNGVKSVEGLSVDGLKITVASSALNATNVTVTDNYKRDGYTFVLASDVSKPTTTKAAWSLNKTTATYTSDSATAGYTLASDGKSITYSAAKAASTLATVNGVKSLDGISLSGTTITLSKAALGTDKGTVSDGYTLALGSDVTKSTTTKAAWSLNKTTATYTSDSATAGYTLANNQITYTPAKVASTLATVSGVKSLDGISLSGTTITVANSALNNSNVTVSGGYTLKLGSDVTTPTTTKAAWSLNKTTATYTSDSATAGYTLANNQITYTSAKAASTLATVSGVKSLDGLSINGTTITVANSALNNSNVTVSGGYTLKFADDVAKPTTTKAAWSLNKTTATYTSDSATAGYTLASDGKSITYSAAKAASTLATVNGVKSLDGLSLSGTTITVANSALNNSNVTVSDGYTLKLGSDVSKSTTKTAWSFDDSTAAYKQTTSAGYSLENNAITYSKKATTTLAKVKGVKSTKGLSVSGTTITVAKASLNAKKVTVSDGYTLKLGDDVTKASSKKATWTLKNSTATYTSDAATAGYSLENNVITYSKATGAKTLATVKGVKSTKGISVSDNVVTLKNSALSSKVTVSGDYEFNFASDYKKATITGSSDSDTITARGKNLSVNGGKGNDTIKIFGSATTVKGGDGKDTFYYKSSGANVISDYAEEDNISIESGTASVTEKGKNVIFTVGKGKITVTGGAGKNITYIDAGGKKTYSGDNGVKISGKTVTLSENYLDAKFNIASYGDALQTIDASAVQRELKITGNDLKNKIIGSDEDDYIDGGAGADNLLGGKGNDTLVGGKGNDTLEGGKDNDKLTGGAGADVFVYSKGDGNDTITDYAEDDKISIKSDSVSRISTSKKDIVLTLASKGKITITGGADKVISYVDKNGEHTYPETVKFNAKGTAATLTSAYSKDSFNIADYDDYKNSVETINAAAVTHDLNITGNKLANNIVATGQDDLINGEAGADTINGGAGNDSILGGTGNDNLTGGKGADVFIYSNGDGDDVIADFTNEDKIVVASGKVSKVSAKNSDVILKIGKGKITVKDVADKSFPIYDTKDKVLTNYAPASNFIEDDEEILTVNNNSLSAIVKDKLKIGKGKITVKDVADKSFPIYDTKDKVLTNYAPASNFIEDDEEILTVNNNSLSAIVKDKSYASFGSTDTTLNLTADYIPVIAQSNKK